MPEERTYSFIFDTKKLMPACVLLQVLYGGDRGACFFFREWAVSPSTDMVRMHGTESEVKKLAAICEKKREGNSSAS